MNEPKLRIGIVNSRGPSQAAEPGKFAVSANQFGKKTGGAMLKAGELASALSDRGHKTAMLFYEGEGEKGWSGWGSDTATKFVKPTDEHLELAKRIKEEHQLREHEADTAELALALLILDIQGEFDVIDIRGFGIFLWNAFTRDFLLEKLTTPVVWTPAGEGVFEDLKPNPDHYTKVAPLSQAMGQQSIEYGFDPSMVEVIPNAVDSDFFSPNPELKQQTRVELGIAPDQPVIIYTGRIETSKKIDLLFEAWKKLVVNQKFEPTPVLVIMGPPQEGQYKSEKLFNDLTTEGPSLGIIVIGPQDREGTKKYLNAADFFVSPSQREGMSGSVMEACAMELVPILDKKTSGNVDLADENGFLYPRGESDGETVVALEEALKVALEFFSTPDFSFVKKRNRERMKKEFNWDKKVSRYEALFSKARTKLY